MPICSREEMERAIRTPLHTDSVGAGLYRQGYRKHGIDFWALEPGSAVRRFMETQAGRDWAASSVLDVGAGTGKNLLEFVRYGVGRAVGVEIDAYAVSALLHALAAIEDVFSVPEHVVEVLKADARSYLAHSAETFDVVICYGLLHVFKESEVLDEVAELLARRVAPGGTLIIQAITAKYPPPMSQPELSGIVLTTAWLRHAYREPDWSIDYVDETDIEHSHAGSEDNHRHGSVRAVFTRRNPS